MSRVVSIHYTLTDKAGQTLDSSRGDEPLVYLEDVGQIIPGLEEALKASKKGDKKKVNVPSEQAYGGRDDEKVFEVPRQRFPQGPIKVGDHFQTDDHTVLKVVGVTDEIVKLDANHPLAGEDLCFDVEVMEVREATEEEKSHGHAHGPDGHGHHH